ncbi:unnamed protein product (macronuclear) [Paramecium tetraurelia]|uniref:Glycoside hydrolase family 5 domain-containing protein n=1 Tax=Paramecium tetraurelia TaxID=5888 RepID=A0BI69_PARTE|nr:uncharacterized protein GSPATT00029272001 [Paramecium tetraurelia]CAK58236.1 unnamed protein product [Paramecium tetraurelia]|eukprot:XP_001425634.1 hypothetical protein (macronuclear) [Paramecium tetraurelia strain d4-2]
MLSIQGCFEKWVELHLQIKDRILLVGLMRQEWMKSGKRFRQGQIGHISIEYQQMIIIFNYLISIVLCEFQNGYYIEQNETIKIFHGLNLNDYPLTKISDDDLIALSKIGFNLLRISVFFDQLIPFKPTSQNNVTYNSTYLTDLEHIVQQAKKNNFSVILVADQVLLSKQFCGYGFPDWAIQRTNFPVPYDNNGKIKFDLYPNKDQCSTNFDSFLKTDDVGSNFENLYKNTNNLTEYFGLFWQKIAEKMKNEENVLGYDLLNNPQCGNYYKTYYQCIWPGWNNRQLIMPFYQKVSSYIREVEKSKIVFYQTQDTDFIGSGFDDNVNGNEYRKREAYSYRITYKSNYFKELATNLNYYSMWFEIHVGKHAQVPTFLSEFSGTDEYLLTRLLNYADYFQSSWTYKGSIQQALKLDALKRPYAQSICAEQVFHHQYDSINQVFKLQFKFKSNCSTLLFLPYDYGYSCSNCILRQYDKRIFEIKLTISTQQQQQVNIIIWRKKV